MIQTNTYNDADFEEEIDVSRLSNMLLSNCPDLEVCPRRYTGLRMSLLMLPQGSQSLLYFG
jgi:hypothetical protein